MNLRILIYSNPLVVDKIAKSFLYWKDSGFIFTRNLISTFPKDWRIDWLVPEKLIQLEHYDWFHSTHPNVYLIPYPYSTSIHQNRYEFYGNVFRGQYPYVTDVDVIINNQPEIAASLRVWAFNQRRDKPLIYSFFHWIDCKESRTFSPELGGYFWREYEGALHSDAVYLHPYGEELFKQEIERQGLNWGDITFRYFTPPPTEFGNEFYDRPLKKIIMFNHRLNNTTQWRTVVEACRKLSKFRQDFILWLTDENGALKMPELRDLPFVRLQHIPDESYGFMLRNSHFSVCSHKGYSTWNMAVIDSVAAGCPVLIPDDTVYRDMFGNSGWYHHYDDLKDRINEGLDMPVSHLWGNLVKAEQVRLKKIIKPLDIISGEITADITSRLGKLPRKYSQVKDLILAESPVTKRDWANKFWSFHTNSNFQKIRWQLLADGIRDDTTQKESIYYGN